MNVFIDTEFTDLLDPILISLGMVTERSDTDPVLMSLGMPGDYVEEFYVEVPYPDNKCTAFVRDVVLPLIGREPDAYCPLDEVWSRIISWLKLVRRGDEEVHICIDYEADWQLFCNALNNRIPPWVHRKMVRHEISELLAYDFFSKSGLPQHHALYDARASQYAYRQRVKIGLRK